MNNPTKNTIITICQITITIVTGNPILA